MTFFSGRFIFPFFGVLGITGVILASLLPRFLHEHKSPDSPDPQTGRLAPSEIIATQAPSAAGGQAPNQIDINPVTRRLNHADDALFAASLNQPYGFSYSPDRRKLIWTSSGDQTFKRANIDGSDVEAIVSNFDAPYQIQLENSYGLELFLYFDGALRKRVIDTQIGTSTETVLLEIDRDSIHGLGFDAASNLLYIGDEYGQASLQIELPEQPQETINVQPLILPQEQDTQTTTPRRTP